MIEGQATSSREQLLEYCRASERFSDIPDALSPFLDACLRRVPVEHLQADLDDVCADVVALLDFASNRKEEELAVRVVNPQSKDHGFETTGSILQIVVPDIPFLVDSVSNEIQAVGHDIAWKVHAVVGVRRDESGVLEEVTSARGSLQRESVQHYELAERLSDGDAETLASEILSVLEAVRSAVSDFEPMQSAVYRMIKVARDGAERYERAEVDETVAFLEWLLDENFVFLGYREYQIEGYSDDDKISVVPDSGLGLLARDEDSSFSQPVPLEELSRDLKQRFLVGDLVAVTKTNSVSPIHRRARMDYIGVRRIGPGSRVIGEARLIGLFTSKAYMEAAADIPILRQKLESILQIEDTIAGSHYHKQIVQIFNSFPKDSLFATATEGIQHSIVSLIQTQEQEGIRLFIQSDLLQRNVSVLVVVTRDRFSAELRKRLQGMLMKRFNGGAVDYQLSLGEIDTARMHFTVWSKGDQIPDVSYEEIEAAVLEHARTWEERVTEELVTSLGTDRGAELAELWPQRFPDSYRASVDLVLSVGDIQRLDEVRSGEADIVVGLQNGPRDEDRLTRLGVFRRWPKMELSVIMPVLEDLGLRVVEEVPTRLRSEDGDYFIHDFGVVDSDGNLLDIERVGSRVVEAVSAVLEGANESDSLHRLILTSNLDHRQICILRAYRTYWQRVRPGFTVEYLNDAYAAHPAIAEKLVELFEARFKPDPGDKEAETIALEIRSALVKVVSLDEDRILRGLLELIEATLRTSYYQPDVLSLSLKFLSAKVPEMPSPIPLCEIFVYNEDIEGIHLRGGSIARGGIRWSTRKEDYRTEVLGLMKAQMTKNAVIVPTGAKGGYVLRNPPTDSDALRTAVRDGYKIFIRGLLDLTDNRVDGGVVHPEGLRIYDELDSYLVVAADKGTARFSDVANEIADEYGFWLGDAFASGGSAGYDHKELGVTARGAWESAKWKFHELDQNLENGIVTAIGIGDMSGDVFGNGMLQSNQLLLVAAFDHRHIFIDPHPNALEAFAERLRLHEAEYSTWASYDRDLISDGGGIWERSLKQIDLSPAARDLLGVSDEGMTPDEVIRAILRAPVDLLWNGGVGTFVKASDETHVEVDDRTNDGVRVDAKDLRCKVAVEGGNLGFTQDARIEYFRHGGQVSADFVDNSGGVNCSDREVNLKILLGLAEQRGSLTRSERDDVISTITEDVVKRVLYDNFLQAQILSREVTLAADMADTYEELMVMLEREGLLDRALERLPSSEVLRERSRSSKGLTGPELAVLLAYSKRLIRGWILESELPDSGEYEGDLREYFPPLIVEQFGDLFSDHPLFRELVSTILANEVVNYQGIVFVTTLMAETGASTQAVMMAYRTARFVTDAAARRRSVESLFGSIPISLSRELFGGISDLVENVTRWYLHHPETRPASSQIGNTLEEFTSVENAVTDGGPVVWNESQRIALDQLVAIGVPQKVAIRHVFQGELVHAPAVIEVAATTNRSIREVIETFLFVGSVYDLDWLETQATRFGATDRWEQRASGVLKNDLRLLQRELSEMALIAHPNLDGLDAVRSYRSSSREAVERLERFMSSLISEGVDDTASLVVAVRRIRSLAVRALNEGDDR